MATPRKAPRRWIVPLGLLILIVLPFLGARFLKKQSDQAWQEFASKWENRGEQFELRHYALPAIPDSENLARHPAISTFVAEVDEKRGWLEALSKTLPGWNQDRYLEYLSDLGEGKMSPIYSSFGLPPDTTSDDFRSHLGEPYQSWSATLDPLVEAVREREHLWYDLDWSRLFVDVEMPKFSPLFNLGKALLARAAIRRGLHESNALLADFETTVQISRAYTDVPLLISLVFQAGLHAALLDELRSCLRERLFDADQLAKLADTLEQMPPLQKGFLKSLRMERALILAFFEAVESSDDPALLSALSSTKSSRGIRGKLTRMWMNANRLALCQNQQELFLSKGGQLAHLKPWETARQHRLDDSGDRFLAPLAHFALSNFGLGGGVGEVMFVTDANIHRARLAVALERFRLAQGGYPSTLGELVPTNLRALPILDPSITIDYASLPDGSWRLRQTVLSQAPNDWTSK
jgi:hypothetical protein